MDLERKKFQGVLNILSFNRHFYVIGISVLIVLLAVAWYFHFPVIVSIIILIAFIYGLIIPLIVSAYVYDFSGYYNLHWLDDQVENPERLQHIVNINAGFDETSFLLHKRYPQADIKVFDFYNAKQHTEPAIVRARKVSLFYPGTTQILSNAIPLNDNSVDIVFLLSAAHEIRNQKEKIAFLKECHRICKPSGRVIMVEHLRDFPNFLAFTVGFTHFFSRHTWLKAFTAAGFSHNKETKFTPFMSIFNCTN